MPSKLKGDNVMAMMAVETRLEAGVEQDDYLVSKRYAWGVLLLGWLLGLTDFVDRQVIASLFPYLKAEWDLSDAQLGVLVGIVHISMSIFAFPASLLIDRWSRKKTIAIMGIAWSAATLACAFTRSFGQLFIARFFIGAGEGGYGPGLSPLLAALFPARLRATVLGLALTMSSVGGVLGVILGGFIATHYGWRHAFGVVAIPGFILAVMFFFIRDYKTIPLEVEDKESRATRKMNIREIIRRLIATPSLVLTYFGAAAALFYTGTILNWAPSFFNRVYGLPMDQASLRAAVLLIATAVGVGIGGYIVDTWKARWKKAVLVAPALFCAFTAVVSAYAYGVQRGPAQFPLIVLGSTLMASILGPSFNVSQTVVHPGLRATAAAILILVQNGLGLALGPLAAGILSDKYDIQTSLAIVSLVPLAAAVLYFIGAFYYEKDLAKTEKVAIDME
jgi:MFS family permease